MREWHRQTHSQQSQLTANCLTISSRRLTPFDNSGNACQLEGIPCGARSFRFEVLLRTRVNRSKLLQNCALARSVAYHNPFVRIAAVILTAAVVPATGFLSTRSPDVFQRSTAGPQVVRNGCLTSAPRHHWTPRD